MIKIRKFITTILALCLCGQVFGAISDKYNEGYTFEATGHSTAQKEYALSQYKDSSFIFVRDSTVYITKLDSLGELEEPKVCEDFKLLKFSGTIAYDKKRDRIYYSKYNDKYKADYLYESICDKDGVWQEGKRMRIRGTVKARTQMSFVQNAGWNYRLPYTEGFYNPVMAKDNDRVYFSSTMEGGQGGRDIYYTDIEDEAERIWKEPVNVAAVNTADDDDWALVEGDSLMYLSSGQKEAMAVFTAAISGEEFAAPQKLDTPYNDSASNYNLFVVDGTPLMVSNRNGNDDIFLFKPIPEPEPEPEPEPTYEEKKRQFYWVFFLFDFDKDILDEQFQKDLDSLSAQMRYFAGEKFEISGYTDSRGSDEYNDMLSLRRAETIRKMLLGKGFTEDELVAVGYGERRLQYPNAVTEEEHAQNRRVEVRIIQTENIENVDADGNVSEATTAETSAEKNIDAIVDEANENDVNAAIEQETIAAEAEGDVPSNIEQ